MNGTRKVVLAGACRTPIGVMGGALGLVPAARLGETVIREAMRRAGIRPEQVDEVYMGCVIQAGLGQNLARQAAVNAGIPVEAPAATINVLCGSGLHCVNLAAKLIQAGHADIIVAGGAESMTGAPYLIRQGRMGYRMGNGVLEDSMICDALTDAFGGYHMGITAENIANEWGISRKQLDEFAAGSQEKACAACESGRFRDEIVPVEAGKGKNTVMVERDEAPRYGTTAENISRLKPAFKQDGIVTAGNSSGVNDGAAAVVVMSEERAKELGVPVQAVWTAGELAGVEPRIMGIGPVAATRKTLQRAGMTMEQFDLIEANEAFAAQSVAVQRDLGIKKEILNVNGGAIALGHPVGASGCRILVTLIHEMIKRDAKTGLATLCVGGGMGCSAVIHRE